SPAGTRVEPPPGSRPIVGGPAPELPHWTEPPTGEVPSVLAAQSPEEGRGGMAGTARWRASGDDWAETEFGDPSELADDASRVGALDTSRTEHSDLFEFAEEEAPTAETPRRIQTRTNAEPARPRVNGRDNRQAAIIGGGLGLLFLILAAAGPKFLLLLVAGVVVALTAELYAVLRRAGYKPATLLGLVAALSMVFGAYWKGERAILLIIVLTVLFTFFWYL